jgi:hypothetical protein
MEQCLVALLPAMLERRFKALLEPRVKEMRTVTDQLRDVPLLAQQYGDMVGAAQVDRLPAIVRPAQNAGGDIRAVGDGRKAAGVETRDLGRPLGGKAVELRRADGPLGSVVQVVISERVGDQQDDVLHRLLRTKLA